MNILVDVLIALCVSLAVPFVLENSAIIAVKIISTASKLLPEKDMPELREQWLSDNHAVERDANRLIHALGILIVVFRILAQQWQIAAQTRLSFAGEFADASFVSAIHLTRRRIHLVHGSRAIKRPPRRRWHMELLDRLVLFKRVLVHALNDRAILDSLMLTKVTGNSFSHMGLSHGARLLALRLNPTVLDDDLVGRIVIVEGPSDYGSFAKRLRIVEDISDRGLVSFAPHQDGSHLRSRPLEQVCAVVLA